MFRLSDREQLELKLDIPQYQRIIVPHLPDAGNLRGLKMKVADLKVGEVYEMPVFGKVRKVQILAKHAFGTIDIMLADGKCYRLTGLA